MCDNCGDGSGWDWHPTYGWVACADCNDDMQKPKPSDRQPAASVPLCGVHGRLEDAGNLEVQISGMNCVACSLNERKELLNLLAPFAEKLKKRGEFLDSVTVLRRLLDAAGCLAEVSAEDAAPTKVCGHCSKSRVRSGLCVRCFVAGHRFEVCGSHCQTI